MFLPWVFCLFFAVRGDDGQALSMKLSLNHTKGDWYGDLTIRSGYYTKSWQGVLMVNLAHTTDGYYRNVCQRSNGVDYTIDQQSALAICNQNNFHKLDSVRQLDYHATPWAKDIPAGVIVGSCQDQEPYDCLNIYDGGCDGYQYYTTLSCSCKENYQKTALGCKLCPGYDNVSNGNDTSCHCAPNFEKIGIKCYPCSGEYYFSLGKYTKCTRCPYGAYVATNGPIDGQTGCRCEKSIEETSNEAWDYESNTCIFCPQGLYKNSTSGRCVQCPTGKTTREGGKTSVDSCVWCESGDSIYIGICISTTVFYTVVVILVVLVVLAIAVKWEYTRRRPAAQRVTVDNSAQQHPSMEVDLSVLESTPLPPAPQSPSQPTELSGMSSVPPTYTSVCHSDNNETPSFPVLHPEDIIISSNMQRYSATLSDNEVQPPSYDQVMGYK